MNNFYYDIPPKYEDGLAFLTQMVEDLPGRIFYYGEDPLGPTAFLDYESLHFYTLNPDGYYKFSYCNVIAFFALMNEETDLYRAYQANLELLAMSKIMERNPIV